MSVLGARLLLCQTVHVENCPWPLWLLHDPLWAKLKQVLSREDIVQEA